MKEKSIFYHTHYSRNFRYTHWESRNHFNDRDRFATLLYHANYCPKAASPQKWLTAACDHKALLLQKHDSHLKCLYWRKIRTHHNAFQPNRVNMKTYIEEKSHQQNRVSTTSWRHGDAGDKNTVRKHNYLTAGTCRDDVMCHWCYPVYNLTRENAFLICYTHDIWLVTKRFVSCLVEHSKYCARKTLFLWKHWKYAHVTNVDILLAMLRPENFHSLCVNCEEFFLYPKNCTQNL